MARVVLVETAAELAGLLPYAAWDALRSASVVWARDAEQHPSAPYLRLAGIEVLTLPSSSVALSGMNLMEPGDPAERRLAATLVDKATEDGAATYLLGPGDSDAFARAVGLAVTRGGGEVEIVFLAPRPLGTEVLRLAQIEQRLRAPEGGCPWDLEQDHRSLARYLVEETYEFLDAVESGDDGAMAEELGDVLLQVVFHAQVAADRGGFDLDAVARGITDKLVRRHPHVFADVEVAGADEVVANWEVLKQQEKRRDDPLEGVPSALPALQLVDTLQRRAAKLGLATVDDPIAAVRGALERLTAVTDGVAAEREIGALLEAAVALARQRQVDPELALRAAALAIRGQVSAATAPARTDDEPGPAA